MTVNSRFFILDDQNHINSNILPDELVKILPRFHFAGGLKYTLADHSELLQSGVKGYLVNIKDPEFTSKSMKKYLAQYDPELTANCSTFKKRSVWCQPDDGVPPDAFFPVMRHHGPKLVLNESEYNCTNSIHRVYFKENLNLNTTDKKLISLSLLSTFSQISTEYYGRSYGSGALKHEPREAERIEILLPDVHLNKVRAAFATVNRMLRTGKSDEARQYVDNLLLNAIGVEDISTEIALMNSGLGQLRSHRHR